MVINHLLGFFMPVIYAICDLKKIESIADYFVSSHQSWTLG